MTKEVRGKGWSEKDSEVFLEHGRYYVPQRERQVRTITALIPPPPEPCHLMDLCCGAGLLSEALLERFERCTVHGYDGSEKMRQAAQERLQRHGDRFRIHDFTLEGDTWRNPPWPVHAVVSSLCIHHLNAQGKMDLFAAVHRLLSPGGVFLIADLIQPRTPQGVQLAAAEWDAAVRTRSLELDGDERALEQFQREQWNYFRHPDPVDRPAPLFYQLQWLVDAGFEKVDVYWMLAGHAVFGGVRPAAPSGH